jgi:hypothetical protein
MLITYVTIILLILHYTFYTQSIYLPLICVNSKILEVSVRDWKVDLRSSQILLNHPVETHTFYATALLLRVSNNIIHICTKLSMSTFHQRRQYYIRLLFLFNDYSS